MTTKKLSADNSVEFDVAIIGGGLVGASLAVAIQSFGLKTIVIESFKPDSESQPSYDERTVALTYSARRIFTGMGVWQSIADLQVEPIKDIHISNKGHFGMTHLSHLDIGTDALGYVVPTRVIGKVLWQNLQGDNQIEVVCPAEAVSIRQETSYNEVEIIKSNESRQIKAKLVVIADGGRSSLSENLGFVSQEKKYTQTAVVAIVSTDHNHNGRAYERFTTEGPLALLPNGKNRYAVVWTTTEPNLEERLALDDSAFIDQLQSTFGDRAGNFSRPSARNSYPLKRELLSKPIGHRAVIVGNAAHTVHPVAGQGFNLGLRDISTLAELICDNTNDVGSPDMLERYSRRRRQDTKMVSYFTHSLIEVFSNELRSLGLLRNLGLKAIELLPPAKRFLLKKTMGLSGDQTQLATGSPLRKQSGCK